MRVEIRCDRHVRPHVVVSLVTPGLEGEHPGGYLLYPGINTSSRHHEPAQRNRSRGAGEVTTAALDGAREHLLSVNGDCSVITHQIVVDSQYMTDRECTGNRIEWAAEQRDNACLLLAGFIGVSKDPQDKCQVSYAIDYA